MRKKFARGFPLIFAWGLLRVIGSCRSLRCVSMGTGRGPWVEDLTMTWVELLTAVVSMASAVVSVVDARLRARRDRHPAADE
ncbi:hypothetical protein GCM10009727_51920 [Actinomadura napierensis]|uniref:DUF4328 domain-containing protein n=1 Tax=Actinomadura napierensis TaxID=267854 RepID=A0ABN2ZX10_9ACTN